MNERELYRVMHQNKWTLLWIACVTTIGLLIQLIELVKG